VNSGIQFINGYKWVDTYYNGVKIAGSQLVEVSGEMLSVPNTYDDTAWLKICGKTVESGEGEKYPDNPYELKSVGDDGGFDLVSAGKNLFDYKDFLAELEKGGYTKGSLLPNKDGVYLKDMVSVHGRVQFLQNRFLPNTAYTISMTGIVENPTNDYAIFYFVIRYTDGTYQITTSLTWMTTQTVSYTSDPAKTIAHLEASRQYNGDAVVYNIQLELGKTATPYTPFRGMQTVHIPYTLRSLPDGTRDYIVIDNVQKRAWYQHILKKDTLSAGTSWTLSDAKPNSAFMSTHISSGYLDGNILTSVEEITEEFEVIYELAVKPEPIELDYNEIKTFYPFTQIYTTATVQPLLEGKIRVWTA